LRGHGDHWLGQVDTGREPGWADQAGRLDQDSAGAAGHIDHAHALGDTSQGEQPLCDLVEESHLVITGGSSTEQAGDSVLVVVHLDATLPPPAGTEQPWLCTEGSGSHRTSGCLL
jgi:hypothetical protein